MMQTLLRDLRFAARMIRKRPGFAAATILTLALGIGANSAIFALGDAALLRPLPFRDPDRLVMLWERTETSQRDRVAPLNLVDWDKRNTTFDGIAGFAPNVGSMVLSMPDGTPINVSRQWVTHGFFDVLGVKPIVGRTFLPGDDASRSNIVVMSEAFWRANFNADPGVVGRDIRLDGAAYKVAGIVPREFQSFGRTGVWALASIQGAPPAARSRHVLGAIGRLKPGVTFAGANSDLGSVAAGLAQDFPNTNKGRGVSIEPMREALIGSDLRLTTMLLLGVVGFVLLICAANVAGLLLARGVARSRDIAIYSALGASKRRIVRQLITESLMFSIIGCLLGLAIGAAILRVAPSLIPEGLLPPAVTLSFDWRVVSFCFAATLLVGLLCGLAPAWQVTEFSSAQTITSGSRTATGRSGRIRELLVVGEVATAVILLFGAGLLLRTLLAVENVDRGYRAENVLTMVVDPLGSQYPTDASLLQFYEAVEREVMTVPGVRSVAWATTLPLGPSYAGQSFFEIVGATPAENRSPAADYQVVNPTYFRTLDIPIVAGRPFDDRDQRNSVPVCLVNEAFVRRHVRGRQAIGLQLAIRQTESQTAPPVVREIVGVVGQVKGRPDETEDFVQVYVPLAQDPMGDVFMVVRPVSGRGETLFTSIRAAIARVDKDQLVSIRDVMTLEDVTREATARHRFRAALVVTFAGLALLLAMVGLFGVLAYSVQQRLRDFGIRKALGATTRDILGLVVGSAARVIVIGVVIGLAVSAGLSRALTTMLFGVEPLDVVTFAFVTVLVAVTALVAIAGPARRAVRIDPVVALREE
jgi:putative ABC transport system permease protein